MNIRVRGFHHVFVPRILSFDIRGIAVLFFFPSLRLSEFLGVFMLVFTVSCNIMAGKVVGSCGRSWDLVDATRMGLSCWIWSILFFSKGVCKGGLEGRPLGVRISGEGVSVSLK